MHHNLHEEMRACSWLNLLHVHVGGIEDTIYPRKSDEWEEAEVILRETMLQAFLLWAKRRGYRITEGVDVVDPQMSLNTKWAFVGHRSVGATVVGRPYRRLVAKRLGHRSS